MLFISSGYLRYHPNKLILEIDQQLVDYYRALVPKSIGLSRQRHDAHISVVRKETPPLMEFWEKYEGELIEFCYDPIIKNGEIYYWLNVFCVRLEEIRKELGLPVSSPYTRPPDGFSKCFHTTIGNIKHWKT